MAKMLMCGELPTVDGIRELKSCELSSWGKLLLEESSLRVELNELLNSGVIYHYPNFNEGDELVKVMVSCNNII